MDARSAGVEAACQFRRYCLNEMLP